MFAWILNDKETYADLIRQEDRDDAAPPPEDE
jgi:hypothetical protein